VQVRHPDFDFSGVEPIWLDDVETAHAMNAVGLVPAYIEPFLIKVMRRARDDLDPGARADLIRDIGIFNRQEAQHYKFHRALNKEIRESGYAGMAKIEQSYEAEYEEMLATRSTPDRWRSGNGALPRSTSTARWRSAC
jgi:predicted metal-dependent hydrolase